MAINYKIAPSIISADFTRLGQELSTAAEHGADIIHIDAMDGHFVPNLTIGPLVVEACRKATDLPLEVHLMISDPDRYLQDFAGAGAGRLIVHVETCPHLHRTLQSIRELGCEVGVALNPGTPAAALQAVLPMVDLALVMTVNPGFSGQAFIPEMAPKIRELRTNLDRVNQRAGLEVDGGITAETLPLALEAGADVFVAATAVFRHPEGIGAGLRALQACFPQRPERGASGSPT